ncbi:electron transport complex subunit RsxC [Paraglaciecola sp. MB-3u-78]|uniref:electron transport complex subunit RsxC n=1 Tax=Paraglaciecola sp. MB-3u-78 TaxID=2058332 RepID=UPI000C31CFE4|nr:electron transport complex subunit RsxC [Paraglaciecola sp. MB-3u-78]PKH00557.1 electron transport complex subunit RsxC [Paraglaciecola sp. MB-3u-78]
MQNSFDDIIEKLDNHELWDFPGGVFPAERKTLSNQTPIEKSPIPERLYVTVKQHIGVEGQIIVDVGQKVLKGQALTKSMNPFAVPIHAPTSGEIAAIHKHVSAHPSGLPELTVEITSDQQDKWTKLCPLIDYQNKPKMQVLAAICDAGISGMGGAGFPTHIKSSPKKDVEFLIINGIECEPYITSDDRLMREHAWQIRQGIDVLCHLLKPKHVLIGIENNKPEAIEALQVACRENPNYRICSVPTKYPAGGEKQLIQVLTNREVPAQGLPVDVGVIMHNVGTCFAIADAIFAGKPLIERVVTVTGEAVESPGNIWALIGSPVAHLLAHCKYKQAGQKQPNIIMGGPMMGFSVTSDLVPVVKTTNCILAPTDNEIAGNNEQPCIRCSACADVCPASLLPQQLFWHSKAKELDKAQDYNLFDCIECGACAYVCPSEIPLVHYYRIAKSEIRVEQEDKQKSDKARERFEKREARLIAEQQTRDEKHRLAAEARKQAMASNGNNAKDKIAAALARAKAKKQNASIVDEQPIAPTKVAPANQSEQEAKTEASDVSTKAASSNQRVQAAIARAKAKKAAAEEAVTETELKEKVDAGDLIENKPDVKQQDNDVKLVSEQSPQAKVNTQADVTDSRPTADVSQQHQEPNKADSKQAKIAAAVAKAKAKREAQKISNSDTASNPAPAAKVNSPQTKISVELAKTEEQQIDMKKRRIAAAVAKAKAKKAAEIAATSKEDKPS